MKHMRLAAPIVVTTVPNTAYYLSQLGENLFVYYCVDEFSKWPGVNSKLVVDLETKMLAGVNLAVFVSNRLEQYSNFNYIPPVTYASLPEYQAGFDVAIIPTTLVSCP